MSLLVTLYVPEGIVLAGDSRLTLTWKSKLQGNDNQNATNISDTTNKVFLVNKRFGLGTFGTAHIGGIPIAGFIDSFIESKISDATEIDHFPQLLISHFSGIKADFETSFYVVGYKKESGQSVQHIYFVNIKNKTQQRVNKPNTETIFCANWGGETEVVSRLLNSVQLKDGANWVTVDDTIVPWNFLTLQDAIDFARYAIRTTSDTQRFQQRIKTVGGPIDVLVIKPGEDGVWIEKKELH